MEEIIRIKRIINSIKKTKKKINNIQKKLKKTKITSESGAGLIKITMDCTHVCKKIEIDDSLFDENKDVLADLMISALNNINQRINTTQQQEICREYEKR